MTELLNKIKALCKQYDDEAPWLLDGEDEFKCGFRLGKEQLAREVMKILDSSPKVE